MPAGKDERVQPAQRGHERAEELPCLVAEQRDRLGGAWIRRLSRSSRSCMSALVPETPSRPASLLTRRLRAAGVSPRDSSKIEQHARIEIAGARAHHQPAGRREAHGRVDANAVVHGGHARPVAQVRDDHPAVGRVAVQRAQLLQDVFVGEAVEAVARHAGVPEVAAAGRTSARRGASGGGRRCRSRPPAERSG